ncbi:MAG: anhydro-N-acetylmuramic acid kinase [Gammaproteobacteria bacterium]|nr:anhydro-N-acetylmuramic acid kinase [Gammaproteobacteria bacterium]
MSGTSMDAVDVALVRFAGGGCELLHYHQYPIPQPLQSALREAGPNSPVGGIVELDARVGALFADCALESIRRSDLEPSEIAVIGSHGQTLLHHPDPSIRNTLQVGDPNRIAYLTGIRTVADFRRMDMAAGGQGAPLAPAFHAWRFQAENATRIIVNIGGIANVSVLPPRAAGAVSGFDTGPGNILLDQWVRRHRGRAWDDGGEWAASGAPDAMLLAALMAEPYFSRPPPKSTGRDFFNLHWLEARAANLTAEIAAADVQATLLELTARTIADAICTPTTTATEMFVSGGGSRNSRLVARLSELMAPVRVGSTAELGVPPDAAEAMMIAWLAKCRVEGVPANLPSVTGAERPVILGAVYEPGTKLQATSYKLQGNQ